MWLTGFKKFVCWDCRNVKQYETVCEQCGKKMVYMGHKWRPPRKTATHKWKQQQKLWEQGRRPDGTVSRRGRLVYQDWPTCKWCGQPKKPDHPWSSHQ